MLFHAFFRRGCAVLLLAILPGVVCPDAAPAAGTGTGEVVMPKAPRASIRTMENTPCPENMSIEYWNTAPTLWRMAYAHCKPAGALARRSFSFGDASQFIRELGPKYPALGGFEDLFFSEDDSGTFRAVAVMKAKTLSVSQAEIITADVLRRILYYLATNGHDPKEEKLRISTQIVAMAEEGKVLVFAIYDLETGDIRYKTLPAD